MRAAIYAVLDSASRLTVAEWVSIVSDSLVALAAAVAACVAVAGLKSWRRELRGRTEYDLARRLLTAAYKVRNEFSYVRGPAILLSEYPEKYKQTSIRTPEEQRELNEYVYQNRWDRLMEALRHFQVEVTEAEVIWGAPVVDANDGLRRCMNKVRAAAQVVIEGNAVGTRRLKAAADLHAGGEDNALTEEILSAIAAYEAIARPHLQR